MADRLTQIQDCLDQLITQIYATVRYIDTRHHYTPIDGQAPQWMSQGGETQTATQASISTAAPALAPGSTQPSSATQQSTQPGSTQTQTQQGSQSLQQEQQQQQRADEDYPFRPGAVDPDPLFETRLRELAQDLVLKEQQVEALLATLPGLGVSQAAQEQRIAELQAELVRVETETKEWEVEKRKLQERMDTRLGGVQRV